jgi:hypothetical protein
LEQDDPCLRSYYVWEDLSVTYGSTKSEGAHGVIITEKRQTGLIIDELSRKLLGKSPLHLITPVSGT